MFGKEQPDVVTEEEVGEYIEQLKHEGLVDLDFTELEQRVLATPKEQRNLDQCSSYVKMYGGSPDKLCKEMNIKGTVSGRFKGGSIKPITNYNAINGDGAFVIKGDSDELARLSEDSTSGTQAKK